MSKAAAEQIIAVLEQRQPPAAFVTEIAATLRPAVPPHEMEVALQELGESGRILIAAHGAPDVHLEGLDLRVVAVQPAMESDRLALESADAYWNGWLRAFLSTHRCQ